jgi:hypothetical protein
MLMSFCCQPKPFLRVQEKKGKTIGHKDTEEKLPAQDRTSADGAEWKQGGGCCFKKATCLKTDPDRPFAPI